MLFTTSWDDGREGDLKVALLLEKYGATGTFYVSPPATHENTALSDSDIRSLAKRHEIGAHTITHPRLTRLAPSDARREIVESKKWIEQVTQEPCRMFCYPYGDENPALRTQVMEAGFLGARTVEQLTFEAGDPFGLPTTLQVYPFPFRRKYTRWWHPLDPLARLRLFLPRMYALSLPLRAGCSWLCLARELFTYAQKSNRPFFHLWGHSSEIEKYGMWPQFEAFLKFVQGQRGVSYGVNSAVVPLMKEKNKAAM